MSAHWAPGEGQVTGTEAWGGRELQVMSPSVHTKHCGKLTRGPQSRNERAARPLRVILEGSKEKNFATNTYNYF